MCESGLPLCPAHILGVIKCDLTLALASLIDAHELNLTQLNISLSTFPFASEDAVVRPCKIIAKKLQVQKPKFELY